jgi:hypothetical protein
MKREKTGAPSPLRLNPNSRQTRRLRLMEGFPKGDVQFNSNSRRKRVKRILNVDNLVKPG